MVFVALDGGGCIYCCYQYCSDKYKEEEKSRWLPTGIGAKDGEGKSRAGKGRVQEIQEDDGSR